MKYSFFLVFTFPLFCSNPILDGFIDEKNMRYNTLNKTLELIAEREAKVLVEMGHTVSVLTGLPNYPEGVVPDEYRGKNYKKHANETLFGAHITRARLIGRGKGPFKLLLKYLFFAFFTLG